MPTREKSAFKTYAHRHDPDYLERLREVLSVDHLIETATELPDDHYSRKKTGAEATKQCEIAFVGFSATNLFDRSRRSEESAWRATEAVLSKESRQRMVDENIWLRVRLLFLYPYSTHAMSIINAENSSRRTATCGHRLHPFKQQYLHVAEDDFYASSLYRGLKNSLRTIQEWIDGTEVIEDGVLKQTGFPNRDDNSVEVRFTPINPNLCGLIINRHAFCDPYILAKERRWDRALSVAAPLVEVDGNGDAANRQAFGALVDHCRYLWQLNVTLDCKDATHYEPNKQESLAKIKRPAEISFEHKADRLSEERKYSRPRGVLTSEERSKWILRAKRQFSRYRTLPVEDNPDEHVFIACGWEAEGRDQRQPNTLATNLEEWLRADITRNGTSALDARILRGAVGDSLPARLYDMLGASFLGIVLLTPTYRTEPVDADSGVRGLVPRRLVSSATGEHAVAPAGTKSGTKGAAAQTPLPAPTEANRARGTDDGQAKRLVASPNVYHELGFLMSQLDRHMEIEGGDRHAHSSLFLAVQKDTEMPSNVGHRIYHDIEPLGRETPVYETLVGSVEKWRSGHHATDDDTDERLLHDGLALVSCRLYLKVLQWLGEASGLVKQDKAILDRATRSHIDRLYRWAKSDGWSEALRDLTAAPVHDWRRREGWDEYKPTDTVDDVRSSES